MSRIACVLLLFVCSAPVRGAELPPGAVARLGDPSFRAGSRVEHLALSPDGKHYATGCAVGRGRYAVTVWDSSTGRRVREQKLNVPLFRGLVWGAGGSFAVALRTEPGAPGRAPKVLWDDFGVWDFADPKAEPPPLVPSEYDGAPTGQWKPPETGPRYEAFTFSADGRRLAAGWRSVDGKHAVRVFELKAASTAAKLTQLSAIDLGAEVVDAFRLSADGNVLVTFRALAARGAVEEWTATAWDVATGRPAKPVRVSGRRVPLLAPDGRAVLAGAELVRLDGTRAALPPPTSLKDLVSDAGPVADEREPAEAAFFPSGDAWIEPARWTTVFDLKTNKERGRFGGHAAAPTAVAVSADGARVATADRFGLVRLWDVKTMRPLTDIPGHRAPIREMELSPDGKRLLTLAADETVRLWDVATGKELRSFARALTRGGSLAHRPRFTPDGTAVVYNAPDRLIARDLQTGLEVPLAGGLKDVRSAWVAFSPDGKSVLTWSESGGPLEVWEWPSGKTRFAIELDGSASEPGFAPDGAVFADATRPERWDGATGKPRDAAWKGTDPVSRTFGLRDDLRPLVAESESARAPRVLAVTGKLERGVRLAGYDSSEFDSEVSLGWNVALAPDRRQFALALGFFERDEVRIYESATGTLRRVLPAATRSVFGFTPDGSKLLTACDDHTVLVWDVRPQAVPLPDAFKKETGAAKLWDTLVTGNARVAYLAMARLSREPDAAVKIARMRLKPAATGDPETEESTVADSRALELLEALATDEALALLKALAAGAPAAFRTQEAQRALERLTRIGYNPKAK